jgi:hypothetical protein
MTNDLLIHATGLAALALNVVALVCTCERRLRVRSGIAGMAWALNNFLLGAHAAAALSVVSAGRTATSAATLHRAGRARRIAFLGFVALTLGIGVATWNGWPALVMTAASVLSTYAVFHMTGRALRWTMLVVSAMWMLNAWTVGSWEQIAANLLSGVACLVGACRVERRPALRLEAP